ncbi:MAG: hypothetical protein Q9160_002819 [Pyrenula sp. 1 TL-2023]
MSLNTVQAVALPSNFFMEVNLVESTKMTRSLSSGLRIHQETSASGSSLYQAESNLHDFTPIPELLREDASILLLFLTSNSVIFNQPVDDDYFADHRPINVSMLSNGPQVTQVYLSDEIAHVFGCVSRDQYCLNKTRCTPLTASALAAKAALDMTKTCKQRTSLESWYTNLASLGVSIFNIVGKLGASALVARNTKIPSVQGPLLPDQWQLEVEHWQAVEMALIQRITVEQATGPSNEAMQKYIKAPSTEEGRKLCRSQCSKGISARQGQADITQKVKSASHTSFIVLGLCITLILGGIIILLEVTIEPLLHFIQKRRNIGLYQRLEWVTNETLQLQRLAHEALDAGTWSGADSTVPTTAKGELLASLDTANEKHPRLVYEPPSGSNEKLSMQTISAETAETHPTRNSHESSASPEDDSNGSKVSEEHEVASSAQSNSDSLPNLE